MITRYYIRHKTRKSLGFVCDLKDSLSFSLGVSSGPYKWFSLSRLTKIQSGATNFTTRNSAEVRLTSTIDSVEQGIARIPKEAAVLKEYTTTALRINDPVERNNAILAIPTNMFGFNPKNDYRYRHNPALIDQQRLNEVFKSIQEYQDFYVKELDTLRSFVVDECEVTLNYKPNLKKSLRWYKTTSEVKKYGHCCLCGYSIPDMNMMAVTHSDVHICVICLKRLATESERQYAEVDPAILEHYTNEKFINDLG